MELPRQDPELLLKAIRTEEPPEGHGKLKIFFGYAAGVGKTYAMLEAAHQAKQRGMDVVAGYIEPHARPQTTALLEDMGNLAANELYRPDGSCLPPKQAAEKMLAGIEAIAAQCNHLIIVSNEVFSGGADYAGETDLYLQALAMVNNTVAAKADAVCRVVCGLPVYYKGGERP